MQNDVSSMQGARRWVFDGLTIAAFLILNASLK